MAQKKQPYRYTVELWRDGEASNSGIDRTLVGGNMEFRFEGDPACMKDSRMTGMGLKIAVQILCDTIAELSKEAAQNGYSEGEIIADAIRILEYSVSKSEERVPANDAYLLNDK